MEEDELKKIIKEVGEDRPSWQFYVREP